MVPIQWFRYKRFRYKWFRYKRFRYNWFQSVCGYLLIYTTRTSRTSLISFARAYMMRNPGDMDNPNSLEEMKRNARTGWVWMIMGWFWNELGMILGCFWNNFRMILECFGDDFGTLLTWIWNGFEMILEWILCCKTLFRFMAGKILEVWFILS